MLVIGVALLRLFSDWNSNSAPLNLLIGHILVTTPYVVRTVTASLLLADVSLEEAARTLGAGRWRVFRRVTLPQIAPGVAAGTLFAFMVSFDNYPISMWLADAQNVPMPMLIYRQVASIFTPGGAGDVDADDPVRVRRRSGHGTAGRPAPRHGHVGRRIRMRNGLARRAAIKAGSRRRRCLWCPSTALARATRSIQVGIYTAQQGEYVRKQIIPQVRERTMTARCSPPRA